MIEVSDHREIQLGLEIGRENKTAMTVDDEWLHGGLPVDFAFSRFSAPGAGYSRGQFVVVHIVQLAEGRFSQAGKTVVPIAADGIKTPRKGVP
nr:hypothetical protein [uncultured Actinoplanes sp.]